MLKNEIFDIHSTREFEAITLQVFKYQFESNPVYNQFCNLLKRNVSNVHSLEDIPFLPIEFFKSREVICDTLKAEEIFTSSGTTGTATSRHYVSDLKLYEKSFIKAFEKFYGNPEEYTFLALLPSYLERTGSSLIYMVNSLISLSRDKNSGFYLNNLKELSQKLIELDKQSKKVFLIGVSFALLDLIEIQKFSLKNTIIMETGGMKGRRKEMIREELHKVLQDGFGVARIHSEYGMTELLSQAYSKGEGIFECPPWMKILIRDPEDALTFLKNGKTGGLNVIDLANLNSCSFIATQDLGRIKNKEIEILGRFDNSDVRGCNLLLF